ncbi:MAG: hypothetical protein K8G78_11500 [Deltaproteobacteria bacterium]|nr:hypothetical protein [Candidatus Kapabacteria bacterium]
MDNQAYVDSVRLRAFAAELAGFVSSTDRCADLVVTKLLALGQAWEDAEYLEFKKQIVLISRRLSDFSAEANRLTGHLLQQADAADMINQRLPLSAVSGTTAGWNRPVQNLQDYEPEEGEVFFCGGCKRQQLPSEGIRCKLCGRTTVSWHINREQADDVMKKWQFANGTSA